MSFYDHDGAAFLPVRWQAETVVLLVLTLPVVIELISLE